MTLHISCLDFDCKRLGYVSFYLYLSVLNFQSIYYIVSLEALQYHICKLLSFHTAVVEFR